MGPWCWRASRAGGGGGGGVLLGSLPRPAQEPIAGVLALRVGLAVGQALGALGLEPRLKWPNDVVMGDKKGGGVLCEARAAGGGGGLGACGVGGGGGGEGGGGGFCVGEEGGGGASGRERARTRARTG